MTLRSRLIRYDIRSHIHLTPRLITAGVDLPTSRSTTISFVQPTSVSKTDCEFLLQRFISVAITSDKLAP